MDMTPPREIWAEAGLLLLGSLFVPARADPSSFRGARETRYVRGDLYDDLAKTVRAAETGEGKINSLTGTTERYPPPSLTDDEVMAIKGYLRVTHFFGRHVNLFGREYWADPDGKVYVVAFESGGFASGDPI